MENNENKKELDKELVELIKKANDEIKCIPISRKNNKTGQVDTKMYAEVWQRVIAFRKVYPLGCIKTEITEKGDNLSFVTIRAYVYDYDGGHLLATSEHQEKKDKSGNKWSINEIDILGNCETSAIGRALGLAGFIGSGGIASVEDMQKTETIDYDTSKDTGEVINDQQKKIINSWSKENIQSMLDMYKVKSIDDLTKDMASKAIEIMADYKRNNY